MGKSAEMHATGFPAFLAGDFKPFTGFDQAVVGNQLLIAARFKTPTEHEIRSKILNQLGDIENLTGCYFLLAGRDYPLHCTLKIGEYSGDEDNKELRFTAMAIHPELFMFRQKMRGTILTFENLVIDSAGNGLLTNDSVKEGVLNFRSKMDVILSFDTDCFAPKPIGWMHCSLFRTFKGPDPNRIELFSAMFAELVNGLNNKVISAEIAEVVVVNCYDFLT